MRTRLALALLWLAACQSPEDLFELRGSVARADGTPARGQQVSLSRMAHDWLGGCRDGRKAVSTTSADDGGAFGFELFRIQVQPDLSGAGGPECLRFEADLEGARSWVDVAPTSQQVMLGRLRPWEPQAQVDVDAGTLTFAPPLLAPGTEEYAAHARVSLAVAEGVLWTQELDFADAGAQFTAPFPAVLLEGRAATLTLEARQGVAIVAQPGAQLVRFDTQAELGNVPAAGGTASGGAPPPSRGAACPAVGTPCPLTDGLVGAVPLNDDRVTLELAAPLVVRRVVVRGASPDVWPGTLVLRDAVSGEERTLGTPVIPGVVGGGSYWLAPDGGLGGYLISYFPDAGVGAFFAAEVDPPLPAARRYEVIFPQPLTALAELSLLAE